MEQNMDSQALVADFCSRFDIRPAALPHTTAGHFEVVNPGQKDLGDLVNKVWRKMSEEEIDSSYIDYDPAAVFNLIRDYARCGVLMNHFSEAPALVNKIRERLGGEVSVHNRDTYKAIHLHTQLGGINCEVQFHTFETYSLKQAEDISYQKWRKPMAEDKAAVLANPDYIEERKVIRPLCQTIYGRSGFDQVLPEIAKLQAANQPVPSMTHTSIGNIYRRSSQVQDQLMETVRAELTMASSKTAQEPASVLTKAEIDALLNGIATIHSDDDTITQEQMDDILNMTGDTLESTNEK